MRTEYTAQIRKLRLPEQDELKNESERCSADPVMLESIGRALGQQVRIKRSDESGFVALYTVKQANPDADLSEPEQAGVVRAGQTGRERLGTADEMEATVQAKVVDAAPQSGAVSFFELAKDEADIYIGGGASRPLKGAIERALSDLDLRIAVKISTCYDDPKFQGFSPENIINRLSARGIHLEQSFEARKKFGGAIACAVAEVFASRRRFQFCIFIKELEKQRADAEAELSQSLSKELTACPIDVERAIEKHKAWRAKDDALAAKIKDCEELRTFIEERIEESKTTQPEGVLPPRTIR
jgi:hypothetical protein